MNHVKLFQALAATSPSTAACYIAEMWCRPVISLYAIDTSHLTIENRDEVIETRVLHKRELQALYQWLWNQADSNAGIYEESLVNVERALADFAKTDIDARSFVLDVTGWTDVELSSVPHCGE